MNKAVGILLACDRLVSCVILGKIGVVKLSSGLQIVFASLIQFCQPRTISPPYFPQITQLTNLLPIQIGT